MPIADRFVVLCGVPFQFNQSLGTSQRAHLERKVFQGISNALLRLEASASFYEDGDGRSGLVVVDGGDFDAGRVDDGGKRASNALNVAHGRRSGGQHREF